MRAASFLIGLASTLGIPLGSKRRSADGKSEESSIETNDFINSIIDITRDDVCIGETPLFFKSSFRRLPKNFKDKVEELLKELNTIVSWVALDVLKTGTSIYHIELSEEGKVKFIPFLGEHDVYLTKDKEIIVVSNGKTVEDVLVFLFYEKDMLEIAKLKEHPDILFKVKTVGLQLKNAKASLTDLQGTERFIARARAMMRIVRYATVEVGISKSDRQQEIVDDVSEGLNSNSMDMPQDPHFDDQIPVFPMSKGVGAPKVETDTPNFDLGQLSDLDYNLSKLFLSMRFPKTYADFSQNLSPTAVSLIRGDIRYSKLIGKARSIIENTINSWVSTVPSLKEKNIQFHLTALPTPEADDVTTTLQSFADFTSNAMQFIIDGSTTADAAYAKLKALTSLFAEQTNIKSVERWSDSIKEVIVASFGLGAALPEGEEGASPDLTGSAEPPVEGEESESVVSNNEGELNELNTPELDNVGV